jgi:tetratricopeptide (TPR) repeat protein
MSLPQDEIIERADALYRERENISKVKESVELLQELKDNYEALWRLSRAYFFLGQEAETREDIFDLHMKGKTAAGKAMSINPQRVEGWFWIGVNTALAAPLSFPLTGLVNANSAKSAIKESVKLDKKYHAAGPLRVLARLESKLPFLLGSKQRARRHYLEAIEIAPTNTVTRIYFAELLLGLKEKKEARKQLETILEIEPDGVWDFEIKRDKKLAKELLKAVNGK